jgi:hypothetical protein
MVLVFLFTVLDGPHTVIIAAVSWLFMTPKIVLVDFTVSG